MTDNKDETGKGPPKPGDTPRRPHATLDLQATEIGGKDKGGPAGAKPSPGASALPPPGSTTGRSGFGKRLRVWSRSAARSNTFLSHIAAGVAGALLTLAAASMLGVLPGTSARSASSDADSRIAALEQAIRDRAAAPGGDVTAKLTATDSRLKGLEDQTRSLAALNEAHSKLATALKALEARTTSPEFSNRIAKLETSLAALSAGDKSGAPSTALADKLTQLEKLITDATEATKSGTDRTDRDLATLKTETGRFGQRLDAIKGDIDERLKNAARSTDLTTMSAKLTAFEHDLQSFLRGEGERTSNATRVLLTLEIANLKRAMDRGDRYRAELDAVRKVAGTTLDLTPLERYSLEGAPALPALTKDFKRVANAAIDAEADPADASVLDRLMSGARSIVRVRKTGHSADDASTEAVVGRMEASLREGRLGEVLEQGKKLPPKAALAAEDWLKKVEARTTLDRSIADIEAALKSSLSARVTPATEPKR